MKPAVKKQLRDRLRRVEGQLRGIQRMVEAEAYCVDVITQTSAVRHALSRAEDLILRGHLEEHVVKQMRGAQRDRAIEEMVEIYQLAKKK